MLSWATMRILVALLSLSIGTGSAQTVTLRSSQLEADFQKGTGLPAEYRLLSNKAVIHGAEPAQSVVATVFEARLHQFHDVKLQPKDVHSSATRADFGFTSGNVSFTLRYELQGAALFVSLENIQEQPGFELIDVGTPDLATVREEDGGGWL